MIDSLFFNLSFNFFSIASFLQNKNNPIMKFFIYLTLCVLYCGTLNAQNFVSTSAENKNVVLEEFTGIHCTYCPDGHLRAQQLHNANPNDVVLVNIHVGSYANPNTGEPDFRTSFGTAISGQSALTGYPAGTVNRRPFSNTGPTSNPSGTGQGDCATCTAMSRGYWTTSAGIVLTEGSNVNVANQTSIDLGSGVLTSVTETYYTANSATGTNYLNVVILQDNVPGPQTGGASYNPSAILPNGDYNHMHMLRHMLNGQWGTTITTTTATHFQADTNNYTIPSDYTGVATSFSDITVSVFITETYQTVTTGAEGAMTYIMPPGAFDVSTATGDFGSSATTAYCANASWTPSFAVTNQTVNVVTSIEAQYTVNGGAAVPVTVSSLSLSQNQSTTVNFPTVTLPAGNNDIQYTLNTLNGSQADVISSNNNDLAGSIAALTASPTATTLIEDFTSAPLPSGTWKYTQTMPGLLFENPNNISAGNFCVFGEASSSVTISNCIRSQLASTNWNNKSGAIVFDNIDLSANSAPGLSFDYAHALLSAGVGDGKLEVFVSTDCGGTWTSVWSRTGTALATGPVTAAGTNFYPTPVTDWATANVDLTSFANQSAVAVKYDFSKGTSANNIYVDNINFDLMSSVNQIEAVSALSIMPNPVINSMNIEFSLEQAEDLNISILNSLGQIVETVASRNFEGDNILTVNTNKLSSGIYFLNITSSSKVNTKRFVISK
jgi:hypothetical protein